MENGATAENLLSKGLNFKEILDFACKCGAYTTMSFGAIAAIVNKEKLNKPVK